MRAFVGLGANLDEPRARVLRAFEDLARLPGCRLLARSSLWRSAPLGHAEQPEFVNAVAEIECAMPPAELLEALLAIETAHGRERSFPNAPRRLDLDLLLYGNEVRKDARLTLPHPRMHERAFVLKPLLEIAPQALIPGRGPASQCLDGLQGQTCERMS